MIRVISKKSLLVLLFSFIIGGVFVFQFFNNPFKITEAYIKRTDTKGIRSFIFKIYDLEFTNDDNVVFYNELGTYKLLHVAGTEVNSMLHFGKILSNYQLIWWSTSADTRYIDDPDLNKLSIDEKLEIICNEEKTKKNRPPLEQVLKIEKGKLYHLAGFNDFDGGYLVYYKNDKFIVKRFDGKNVW